MFSDWPENANLVEDVMILLLLKFCSIPLSNFREEENVKKINDRRKDDGHRVIRIVHLKFWLR